MTTHTPDAASQLVLPRGLIFLAALWLVGSWMLTIGITPPVQASSASYEPGVRMMLQCVVIGMGIGWPLLRLSQTPPAKPIGQTVLDLLVLLTLLQVVIWLPRLLTIWPAIRAAAIDLSLIAWLMLIGAIVASGCMSRREGPRTLAMVGCVAVCLAGPALLWIGMAAGFTFDAAVRLGPLMAVRDLTAGGATRPTPAQWGAITVVGIAAGAAWIALIVMSALREIRRNTCQNVETSERQQV